MIISMTKKMRAVMCLALMHFSAYGITDAQATWAALFAGAVPAAFVANKNEDARVIFGTFVVCTGLAYYYLRKCTPIPIMAQARTILNAVEKDSLAFGYKENYINKEKEEFLTDIHRSYQDNLKEEHFPLIIARNTLINLQKTLVDAHNLLEYTKRDAHKDDKHKKTWLELEQKLDKYSHNTEDALARITQTEPEYTNTLGQYTNLQLQKAQLKIEQQKADAQNQLAQAAQANAKAQDGKAQAFKSYTSLAWLKWFCGSKK